jgi:hypothetical protein
VAISGANAAIATFTAAASTTYSFRLTVTNTSGLQATAMTTVKTTSGTTGVVITSFTASPANISAGQSSTLAWTVTGATSVSISPNIGSVNAQSGQTQVAPTQTTTYTLTATGSSGSVNATVVVTVGTGSSGPQILRFAANPTTIQKGGQSTLSWSTNGGTQFSISGIGTVAANGSTTVSPTQTTTYTLTVTGSNGQTVTAPVTVTVGTGAVPTVVTFVANPASITSGQSTQLCWQVTNATSISISPSVGNNLTANACASVSPTTTTTYVLTATNAAGQIQANATVTVGTGTGVQILSFYANPVDSIPGAPVTLYWSTTNAASIVLTGTGVLPQTLPVNGSTTVTPIADATYTLTAYGSGGQAVSAVVSVSVR